MFNTHIYNRSSLDSKKFPICSFIVIPFLRELLSGFPLTEARKAVHAALYEVAFKIASFKSRLVASHSIKEYKRCNSVGDSAGGVFASR